MLTRRLFLTAATAAPAATLLARPALAAEPSVFAQDGIAIRGADPVAYFTQGDFVQGDGAHALMWQGSTWHFASAENMQAFEANPNAYAPQYGGYCAYAASQGYVASIVPEAWTIHDGKLYLNYSRGVRRRWERNIDEYIAQGDANWPTLLG